MAREINISVPLTQVARGYHNGAFIADELCPIVPVDKRTGLVPTFGKTDFILWDTDRALRAQSNVIEGSDVATLPYYCREQDAVAKLDRAEIEESTFDLEKMKAEQATRALALGREVKTKQAIFNTSNYESSNTVTLSGSYLDDVNVDPIAFMQKTMFKAVRSQIGEYPNTVVMPANVWEFFKVHPKIKAYLPSGIEQLITLDFIKKLLEVDNILVGKSKYSVDGKTYSDVWDNGLWAGYIKPAQGANITPYEPAFAYTFQLKGNPYVDTYDEVAGKVKCYRATDCYDVKIVGKDAGFFAKNVINPSNF